MIDGLGLGGDHAGPDMVVAFVGFSAVTSKAAIGPNGSFLPGRPPRRWRPGSLPAVLRVHPGGGPLVGPRQHLKFTGRSRHHAAVVGVILNLALFFGYHSLWPVDRARFTDHLGVTRSPLRWHSAWKANVIHVIAGCASRGLLCGLTS